MAIVVESSATATATAASALTINKPSGTASGDVLVAFISMTRSSTINTPPTSWNVIEVSGTYANSHAYWIKAGGSEPANYTWDEGTNTDWAGCIFRLSGVNATTQLDATTVTGEDTSYNTSFTANEITTATDGAIVFAAVQREARYITTGPGGAWTDGYLSAAAPSLGVAYQIVATAGSSGSAVFTASSDNRNAFVTMAFRPAAAATTAIPVFINYFRQHRA